MCIQENKTNVQQHVKDKMAKEKNDITKKDMTKEYMQVKGNAFSPSHVAAHSIMEKYIIMAKKYRKSLSLCCKP